MVKKIGIIQARLSSTRLPGKILKDLCGKTLLERVHDRAVLANILDEVWIATSTDESDDIVELFCKQKNFLYYRGSLENVLKRFCDIVKITNADIIVRITADNPLTEPLFIKKGVETIINNGADYVSFKDIPYGSNIEIVNSKALLRTQELTKAAFDCEHVTPYIYNNPKKFKIMMLEPEKKLPNIRVTIDTFEDYIRMYKLYYIFNQNGINENQFLEKAYDYYKEIKI